MLPDRVSNPGPQGSKCFPLSVAGSPPHSEWEAKRMADLHSLHRPNFETNH